MATERAHGQLVANTVATVTLAGPLGTVDVLNRDGGAEIFFTTDGSTPTAGAGEEHIVPASVSATTGRVPSNSAPVTVKLISTGTPKYTVEASARP